MAEHLIHNQEAEGSIPSPATPPVFDGVRRWKNGAIAKSQTGRIRRRKTEPVALDSGAGLVFDIDLRRKEFRHLRGKYKRDYLGRLYKIGEKPEGAPRYARRAPEARRKWTETRPDGTAIQPTQSRKHLIRDGIYLKSGKPHGVCHRRWREKKAMARIIVRVSPHTQRALIELVRDLGGSRDRLVDQILGRTIQAIRDRRARDRAAGLLPRLDSEGPNGQDSRARPLSPRRNPMGYDNQKNYPHPNQPSTQPASPGTQNPGKASEVGYMDHRGNNASKGGPNYSGGAGTGVKQPANTPKG